MSDSIDKLNKALDEKLVIFGKKEMCGTKQSVLRRHIKGDKYTDAGILKKRNEKDATTLIIEHEFNDLKDGGFCKGLSKPEDQQGDRLLKCAPYIGKDSRLFKVLMRLENREEECLEELINEKIKFKQEPKGD